MSTTWRLSIRRRDEPDHEVALVADELSPTDDLLAELAAAGYRGGRFTADGTPIIAGGTIDELDLVHGTILSLDGATVEQTSRTVGIYLVVAAGPDAGSFLRLEPGTQTVGRAADCDLRLADHLISNRHLQLTIEGGTVVGVRDLDSSNGTEIEGAPIAVHGPVADGVAITCGATVLTLVTVTEDDLPVIGSASDGARAFPRRFREALDPIPARIRQPRPYEDPDSRSSGSWWRPLLPVISGVGLAAITGRWIFLAVVALAPVVLFIENLRRRRVDAAAEERKRAEAEQAMSDFEARRDGILEAERLRRRWVAPIAGLATLHAGLSTRRVWERTPDDEDFCSVPVGLATLRSPLKIEGTEEEVTLDIRQVPVDVPLLETGSLAVLGPLDRGQAVVRGMLTTLATMHAPTDVQLWVITDESRAHGWSFARWLPHCFFEAHGARIAQTPADRSRLLNQLEQILSNRQELRDGSGVSLPVHVVVLDGAQASAGPEVAALLREGRQHGIIGISLDPAVVPEGTAGTVRLGELADEATFESRLQPRVKGLVLPELSLATATRAARSLGALRPVVSGRGQVDSANVVLLEQLGMKGLDADAVVRRWKEVGPTTAVTVGAVAGIPMTMDLVRQGPHGLVGGTTRSGKTEFLKTLLASLALANTPDQLAILIVDFKGGVDHKQSSELPHVVSLSTNDDPDAFARTVELIVAEQRRRQRIFSDAGAANLDVYDQIRARDASLPVVPRLLVVVDEFSELLDSDSGREHLKTLESVTRIGGGLGLHLLLVTQNFQNQLPDQIAANAGLRVCFRVQDPAHSKTVLASGIASTLPHSRPGRAYARFHGGDLTEFQSSRVANRRADLGVVREPVRVLPVPLGAVASAVVEARRDDVAAADSDFARIIDAIGAAADRIGWSGSAIPWLDELPDRVSLASVLDRSGRVGLGVVDRPDEMSQPVFVLEEDTEQLLLIGGPQSGLSDAMLALGTALVLTSPPDRRHLHLVDLGDGALAALGDAPHVSGAAIRDESLALRILNASLDEVAHRRATMSAQGVASISELRARGIDLPEVVLLISGADRMLTQGEGQLSPLLPAMLKLLSEAPGSGLRIVMGGATSLAHHRMGTSIPRRLVMRIAETHEYGALGVRRAHVKELDRPGRAVDVSNGSLVQLASVSSAEAAGTDVVRTLARDLVRLHADAAGPDAVVEIRWPLDQGLVDLSALAPPPELVAPLPLGIEVASGHFAWVDVIDDGPLIGVGGGPKSGRSNALLMIGEWAESLGWTVVADAASRRSPLADGKRFSPLRKGTELSIGSRPAGGVLVLIDDVHRMAGDNLGIEGWLESDQPTGIIVSGPVDAVTSNKGVLRSIPKSRAGLLLAPSNQSDGTAFGIRRLPDDALVESRAGRGLLSVGGEHRTVILPALAR